MMMTMRHGGLNWMKTGLIYKVSILNRKKVNAAYRAYNAKRLVQKTNMQNGTLKSKKARIYDCLKKQKRYCLPNKCDTI